MPLNTANLYFIPTEFLGANVFDDRPFIVMTYMKNGNARDYVHQHPDCNCLEIVCSPLSLSIDFDDPFITVSQIHHMGIGLVYLHSNNIIHGGLKAVLSLIFHFSVYET
jgi:serine/threonine protein kinase